MYIVLISYALLGVDLVTIEKHKSFDNQYAKYDNKKILHVKQNCDLSTKGLWRICKLVCVNNITIHFVDYAKVRTFNKFQGKLTAWGELEYMYHNYNYNDNDNISSGIYHLSNLLSNIKIAPCKKLNIKFSYTKTNTDTSDYYITQTYGILSVFGNDAEREYTYASFYNSNIHSFSKWILQINKHDLSRKHLQSIPLNCKQEMQKLLQAKAEPKQTLHEKTKVSAKQSEPAAADDLLKKNTQQNYQQDTQKLLQPKVEHKQVLHEKTKVSAKQNKCCCVQ